MKRMHILSALVLVAATVATTVALASESQMVRKLAKTTGLAPAEVVLVLGDKIAYAECQYYAHPSGRGDLARRTVQAYRRMAENPPPADASSNRVAAAKLGQDD